MRKQFGQGSIVKVFMVFSDPDSTTPPLDPLTGNTLIDPSVVTLRMKTPAGVYTTYTYGVDVALVRSSAGHYHFLLTLSTLGTYSWKWTGSTANKAAIVFEQADSYTVAGL